MRYGQGGFEDRFRVTRTDGKPCRPQIANIENGRGDPTVSGLRKLADALGVSVKDLVP